MTTSLPIILWLLPALGIGGILGAYFQLLFQHKKEVKEREHELKRQRYGAIIIQMLTKLDPKTGLSKVRQIRPDLKDLDDIEKELEVELLNGVLFASDEVIKSMAEFIRSPSYPSYLKTVVSMRKDLWGKRTSIDEKILDVFEEEPEPEKLIKQGER